MYLKSLLPTGHEEYAGYRLRDIPQRIIDYYNLETLARNGHVYARIAKAWYGLKQAGKIAHDDLCERLAAHGYHKTNTDGLFRHESRDISFTLVVDKFGIKHQ